eukprot:823990-Prorocentrum_minimum.AAC.3
MNTKSRAESESPRVRESESPRVQESKDRDCGSRELARVLRNGLSHVRCECNCYSAPTDHSALVQKFGLPTAVPYHKRSADEFKRREWRYSPGQRAIEVAGGGGAGAPGGVAGDHVQRNGAHGLGHGSASDQGLGVAAEGRLADDG